MPALGVGISFLMVFGTLYIIQGLAVVRFYTAKSKVGRVAQLMIMITAIFIQLVFQGISWLGLFDTWFDFRKLSSPLTQAQER